MSKKKRKSKTKTPFLASESFVPYCKFTRFADNMFESKAWQELSSPAVNIYVKIKTKFNKSNEHDLSLTYAESGMNQLVFQRAIIQLIEHGFIELIFQAKFTKTCNIYGLSAGWRVYPNNAVVYPDWKQCEKWKKK